MGDAYFNRAEVSNSDLGALEKYFIPKEQVGDIEAAYRFGTLVDAVITEPDKVNYFKLTVGDMQYTKEEFDKAKEMMKAFMRDAICDSLLKQASFQSVMSTVMEMEYQGVPFSLSVRCKWLS